MSAWGPGSFDNDIASDWAADLADGGGLEMVRESLRTAALCPLEEYLESDEGSEALAAAEVVAAAGGRPVKSVGMGTAGPHALAWAKGHKGAGSDAMVELAQEAVERVSGPESELVELWGAAAAAEAREFFAELEDLRARLA
ncbi:MAG: DUF4259 domain-containing protein [Solirubrobacterales bacterium]|nr:DUF4259 domain-containing protein [Solirubrobacterales bacterium]